jgi:hypothetical protein
MSLTITAVPDIKYVLGQSGRLQAYQLQPGSSDYPSSGYPITAAQLELGQLIGMSILGSNAAGALFSAKPVLPAASFGANPAPATSLLLEVTQGDAQIAVGTDLSSVTWFCDVLGW